MYPIACFTYQPNFSQPHFTDEKTEVQRGEVFCQTSEERNKEWSQNSNPRLTGHRAPALKFCLSSWTSYWNCDLQQLSARTYKCLCKCLTDREIVCIFAEDL